MGDLVVDIVPFMDTACADGWSKALGEVAKVPFTSLIPGHGPVMTRDDFATWRTAYDNFVNCGHSDAAKEKCVDGWSRDAATFIDAAHKDYARKRRNITWRRGCVPHRRAAEILQAPKGLVFERADEISSPATPRLATSRRYCSPKTSTNDSKFAADSHRSMVNHQPPASLGRRSTVPPNPGRSGKAEPSRRSRHRRRRIRFRALAAVGISRRGGGPRTSLRYGSPAGENGAQERTRTSTPLRAPAPQAGASANSATWAQRD